MPTEYGYVGHNKTFVFKVFAFHSATVIWKRNGKILRKIGQDNSNFTLPNVNYKDSGLYEVVALNDLGKISATTFLVIKDPGEIIRCFIGVCW